MCCDDPSYRNEIFPITATGEPLDVNVNVTILAFPEINTLQLSFIADFILLMRWADPRLEFLNLREEDTLNKLSKSVQKQGDQISSQKLSNFS